MNENVLPHARPESVYKASNKLGVSEINQLLVNFDFRGVEFLNLKNEGYVKEFIISKEIEKNPSLVIMKMYDAKWEYTSYDWLIWLLNDINNPLKELTYKKVLKVYEKDVLERLLVMFKENGTL